MYESLGNSFIAFVSHLQDRYRGCWESLSIVKGCDGIFKGIHS